MMNPKSKILVVEDDKPIRNLITTTLDTQDYHYIVAENGAQAILAMPTINSMPILNSINVIRLT